MCGATSGMNQSGSEWWAVGGGQRAMHTATESDPGSSRKQLQYPCN